MISLLLIFVGLIAVTDVGGQEKKKKKKSSMLRRQVFFCSSLASNSEINLDL